MPISAIIVAAGSGKRLGSSLPKQFIELNAKPVLAVTVEKFEHCCAIDDIIIVAACDYLEHVQTEIINRYGFKKVKAVIPGGNTRQASVYNGLKAIGAAEIIVIHDGARPFVSADEIAASIEYAKAEGASVIGVKAKNTIKSADAGGFVSGTPNRDELYEIQTPQTFQRELIMAAYEKAESDGFITTDDSALVERLGAKVKIVEGSYRNVKITTEEDLLLARLICNQENRNFSSF